MPASVFGSPPILEWYRTQCKIARFWRIQWEEVQPTVLQSQSEIGRKTIVLESQWHSGLESMNLGHKLSHFRSNFIYTSFMFCGISLSLSFSFSSPPPLPRVCGWIVQRWMWYEYIRQVNLTIVTCDTLFQRPLVWQSVRQPAQGGRLRQHPGLCHRLPLPAGVSHGRLSVLWLLSRSCQSASSLSPCSVVLGEILRECVIFACSVDHGEIPRECVIVMCMCCRSWRDPARVRHLYVHVL